VHAPERGDRPLPVWKRLDILYTIIPCTVQFVKIALSLFESRSIILCQVSSPRHGVLRYRSGRGDEAMGRAGQGLAAGLIRGATASVTINEGYCHERIES
jgi:hypothetical protein